MHGSEETAAPQTGLPRLPQAQVAPTLRGVGAATVVIRSAVTKINLQAQEQHRAERLMQRLVPRAGRRRLAR